MSRINLQSLVENLVGFDERLVIISLCSILPINLMYHQKPQSQSQLTSPQSKNYDLSAALRINLTYNITNHFILHPIPKSLTLRTPTALSNLNLLNHDLNLIIHATPVRPCDMISIHPSIKSHPVSFPSRVLMIHHFKHPPSQPPHTHRALSSPLIASGSDSRTSPCSPPSRRPAPQTRARAG